MAEIKTGTFKMLEELVSEYPQMGSYIKQTEEELLNPWQESDNNVGGGRSSLTSDTTGRKALTIATDKHLRLLKERKVALDKVIRESRKETLEIIKMWYWTKPRTKTWDGVAETCHLSRRMCITLRNDFIATLAVELGETN